MNLKPLPVQSPVNRQGKGDREHVSVYHHKVRLHVSGASRGWEIHSAFPFFFFFSPSTLHLSSSTIMTNMSSLQCFARSSIRVNPNTHSACMNNQTDLDDSVRLSCICHASSLSREKNAAEETENLLSPSACTDPHWPLPNFRILRLFCLLAHSGHIPASSNEIILSALRLRISVKFSFFFHSYADFMPVFEALK